MFFVVSSQTCKTRENNILTSWCNGKMLALGMKRHGFEFCQDAVKQGVITLNMFFFQKVKNKVWFNTLSLSFIM